MVSSNVHATAMPIRQVIVVVQVVEKISSMPCTRYRVSYWVVLSETRVLLFVIGQ